MSEGLGEQPGAEVAGGGSASASLVLRLARLLVPGLSRGEVARELAEVACALFAVPAAWLLVCRNGELHAEGAVGLPPEASLRLAHVPLDAPCLEARALRAGRALHVRAGGLPEELAWTAELLDAAELPGMVAVPLAEGEIRAVLGLGRAAPPDEAEAPLLQLLGRIFSAAFRAGFHHLDVPPADTALGELERIRAEIARCRKVEAELRESEERFRLAIDEAPIGMAVVALTGRFVRVNKALCEITGYDADELLRRRWQDITHPADLKNDLELVAALVKGRIPRYEMEKRYVRKDGGEVRVLLGVSLLRDPGGAPWYFVSRVEDVTERRRIEEQLRRSEQMFRGLFDTALDPIAIVDDEGRIVDVNDACCTLLGIERERLVGHRVGALRGRLVGFDVAGALRSLRAEGARKGELRIRDAAGAIHVLEFSARAQFVPGRHLVMLRDVTDRVRGEEELRAREWQLAEAQAIAHVGHFEIDREADRVTASAEAFRIYGWPAEQGAVSRATLVASLHPADRDRIRTAFAEAAQRLGAISLDHRILRPDGEERWVHSEGRAYARDGHVRILGVVQDITEQRSAARERERLLAALAAERTWLETLIEHLPVAVLLVDAEGALRANRRAEALLGPLAPDVSAESIGLRLRDAGGRPVVPERMPLARAEHGEATRAEEIAVRRSDGTLVPGLVSAAPIRDEAGRYLGAVAVFEETTALKELERMREEWTSVVAHDLRQPVTVINAYAQLLERTAEAADPKVAGKIGHIRTAARQLNRMIGDLLDVGRIDARRLALERRPEDLEALSRSVVERLGEELAGHEVRVVAEPALPPVSVDPVRFEQILGNLLSNAVKYGTPDGPITLEIARAGPGLVACSVTNEGRGIDPGDLPSLFDRFFRARNVREGKVAGLGLGLYITRGLVEAHGGTIEAWSEPGRTTTLRFTMPVA